MSSRRQLKMGPLAPFEQTVAEFQPSQRIVYKITKGNPLRGPVGTMTFEPAGERVDSRRSRD